MKKWSLDGRLLSESGLIRPLRPETGWSWRSNAAANLILSHAWARTPITLLMAPVAQSRRSDIAMFGALTLTNRALGARPGQGPGQGPAKLAVFNVKLLGAAES